MNKKYKRYPAVTRDGDYSGLREQVLDSNPATYCCVTFSYFLDLSLPQPFH